MLVASLEAQPDDKPEGDYFAASALSMLVSEWIDSYQTDDKKATPRF
jgi:hypothetical protein